MVFFEKKRGVRTAASALVLAAAALWPVTPASAAAPAPTADVSCALRPGVTHTDTLGNTFTGDLYCTNAPGDLYGRPAFDAPVTGRLKTTQSWFVCYSIGEAHKGGNNVWYYTQGDETVELPSIKAWGNIPASSVLTSTDPFPGLPRCPWH
ncbi:hypothetical protein DCW30_16400 [Streptomyces alfalfae]|uniref:Secreted protein n=1 Tax=Streptomyces alfalfae TaxID=1642299 RepID=A0A1P8TQB1_9ACTN|nr:MULTISPECIES: hypothetical protein [Streptomyces]AYA20246.1 hypothetical protein D3X13_31885 [Streptomyces fradiae]APY89793.1 hypothetical protein A7J05_32600 [Streptomyces alfalfae]KUL54104.1 hypothetical protein ADL30_16635 [Streptomyces sp. NRRL S-1521]QQC87720.1 hypothetical protein I8755_04330 [Streptomyces alfalfae]RXX43736.1 hypothetical protein DCW30_16400 [Streptomyces alfalfae]